MIKKLIRKMQTAAGGPLRLKFTPEQIAYFESRSLPLGINNSKNYREEGVLALLYQELEKARKELEITSRMEMKPVLVKKASKLGEKDLYKLQVNTAAGVVSPVDPVAEFFMYGNPTLKGAEALFKTGLLGAARIAPRTQLGNYGRLYFVGNAFKNSFSGTVPTLTSQTTSLLYQPVKLNETGLTSLKFFERPSKISEAESLGFGKSRGFNPESGSDLHEFYTLLDRRQTILDALRKLKTPENMGVDEIISKNSGAVIDDGYLMSNGYRYTPVGLKYFSTGTNMSFGRNEGLIIEGHNYGLNLGGESTRVRDLGANSKIVYSGPKANLDRNDPLNLDVVITAENNEANKEGIKLLTKGMRDMESGAEFSGDASTTTTAENLYRALKQAKKSDIKEYSISRAKDILQNNEGYELGTHSIYDPIHGIVTENATMSPDAYSYFLRTAESNPDKFHLGYQMNAGNFNSFARNPKNAYMYDVEQNYLDGLITPQEYVKLFNSWSLPLGGRKAYFYNGRVYKPQPFLIRNKQGGKMNILEFLKNGNKIKKALWGIDLDVDNRSDTTRQGFGTMPDSAYGAADAPNTGGVLSLLDIFNTVKDTGPRNVTLSNGKQIIIPGVLTGTPTFLPTFGPGLLLQGRLVNYVMNPAEKAARADFLKSANEIKTLAGSGHIPKGVQDDWMYPTEILKKYKLKQFSTPVKQEVSNLLKITKLPETSSAKKTSSLRFKEYYSKKKEDKNNGVSRVRSRLVLNNKAQTTGDMRAANTGRPRRAARYTDLRTELEKDTGFWGKQYNKIRKKIALGKQGAESKEKEFLESYWNYKQKGILNKEKFGGNLFKKGGGIHIKKKNRGKFTSYCGGKVTDECIRKAKASGNPTLVKRATFAANARKWKHKKGGKAFVNGVSVLDSNPDAYKYVKKKVKMRLYGGLIPWEITWINNNPSITDANRIFKHNNSILLLTDEYNNLKLLELKKINEEALRYSSFLNEGLKLLFGYLNKSKTTNSTNSSYSNTTLEPKLVYSNGNQFEGGMLNTDSKTFFNL